MKNTDRDRQQLTFSQAQGYEELPTPLRLEELPSSARIHIWNVFYSSIKSSSRLDFFHTPIIGGVWGVILRDKYQFFDNLPMDEWSEGLQDHAQALRNSIERLPFNRVFDLIQFVIRHPKCPHEFIGELEAAFAFSRLAYAIDVANPPTIIPAVTDAEGKAVIDSIRTLDEAGLGGSASHLRSAVECIRLKDWAGSIRESIHAVESVARQLDSKASGTLGPALESLEKRQTLHPALKDAFSKLYGYTSNEQGIRHALLDQSNANVGMDEAVFMLGACASFASYLWRRHTVSGAS